MKLTLLGTGNANVTECYNTCFIFEDNETHKNFLVDAGGGNEILRRLKKAGLDICDIHTVFCTHKHLDHFTGMLWLMRMILQEMYKGKYEGEAVIYAHDEVIELLELFACKMFLPKHKQFIGNRFFLKAVEDGEKKNIMGREVTFFDIGSTKDKQFGFMMELPDGHITCCGDEPYHDCEKQYVKNSKWLMHEAFCLYSEKDRYKPYEKHHSTVKDACELAEKMNVKNLILYHTEDDSITNRKMLYTAEGQPYFSGNLYVPDDMESLELE